MDRAPAWQDLCSLERELVVPTREKNAVATGSSDGAGRAASAGARALFARLCSPHHKREWPVSRAPSHRHASRAQAALASSARRAVLLLGSPRPSSSRRGALACWTRDGPGGLVVVREPRSSAGAAHRAHSKHRQQTACATPGFLKRARARFPMWRSSRTSSVYRNSSSNKRRGQPASPARPPCATWALRGRAGGVVAELAPRSPRSPHAASSHATLLSLTLLSFVVGPTFPRSGGGLAPQRQRRGRWRVARRGARALPHPLHHRAGRGPGRGRRRRLPRQLAGALLDEQPLVMRRACGGRSGVAFGVAGRREHDGVAPCLPAQVERRLALQWQEGHEWVGGVDVPSG